MIDLTNPPFVAIIGGGPAGLMAAETLSQAGVAVAVYDRMATFGRKFLMAGRGGLNLTHSEPLEAFLRRYGAAGSRLRPAIETFPPDTVRAWSAELGQSTFVGSSGRVFPAALKASPLLRAWLNRLDRQGVRFHARHDWLGWGEDGRLLFRRPDGVQGGVLESVTADAAILALGGATWPRLGSDGGWTGILSRQSITIAPLQPANCGFKVEWSALFRDRFQAQPLKNLALSFGERTIRGEALVTGYGIEGGAIYALSASLRDAIATDGSAILHIDLCADRSKAEIALALDRPRRAQSQSNFLRRTLSLSPVAINLLREAVGPSLPVQAGLLADLIKAVPIVLEAPSSLDRAISTAGGIAFSELDAHFMLRNLPGIFAAGEMLDWEAPTGGYLLQGAFATGFAAAKGALAWLAGRSP